MKSSSHFSSVIVLAGSLVASCGHNAEAQSSLSRIENYKYITCPKIDLNSAVFQENAILNGKWEGLFDYCSEGFSGVELTLVGVIDDKTYSYMLHYFPTTSNPEMPEFCQSGIASIDGDGTIVGDASDSVVVLKKDNRGIRHNFRLVYDKIKDVLAHKPGAGCGLFSATRKSPLNELDFKRQ